MQLQGSLYSEILKARALGLIPRAESNPVGPAIALTATATGKRHALGVARALSITSATGGSIYYRFTDASGAIAVTGSDSSVALTTTAVSITITQGMPYIEYFRVGGADVNFTMQPLV